MEEVQPIWEQKVHLLLSILHLFHVHNLFNNLVTLPDSSKEGEGEDDGRGAAELGGEGALGLVTTVFTACCIASQLILEEEASVDCGLPEKLKIAYLNAKFIKFEVQQ